MRIALCSYSQKEKETALLMKLGKVDRFDNGVFCVYAMQRDGPYDAVVVMEDGARGMNFCMSIRGYSRDVPLLWISDQAEFEPQSRRMQADTFLVKPVTEYQLRISAFLLADCSDQELYEAIKPITKWRCENANCAVQL